MLGQDSDSSLADSSQIHRLSARVAHYRLIILICFICLFSFVIGVYAAPAIATDPIFIWLVGTKTVEGAPLRDKQFDFAVHDADAPDAAAVATAKNDAAGHIAFSPIPINEPGVYTYLVSETTPSGNGWTTDDRVYTVTVRVDSIVIDYELEAEVEYPDEGLVFHNIYRASDNFKPNVPKPNPMDNPPDKPKPSPGSPAGPTGPAKPTGPANLPPTGDMTGLLQPLVLLAIACLLLNGADSRGRGRIGRGDTTSRN